MTIEIRPPVEDELRAAMEAAEGAFGSELEDSGWERERKILPPLRALAAYDGDKAVGLAAAYAFDLSIPGGELPCAGVTWVGVLPTHRRRGILRDFMRRQLDDVHGWGEPLAALWASEASIYGRFGYGAAVPGFVAKSNPRRFTLKHDPPSNLSVRLTDAEEAYRLFPPIYDRFRTGRAGMLSRSETWWKELRLADPKEWRRGASQKFYAVAEVDGNPEGYTTYRIKDEWEEGFAKGEVAHNVAGVDRNRLIGVAYGRRVVAFEGVGASGERESGSRSRSEACSQPERGADPHQLENDASSHGSDRPGDSQGTECPGRLIHQWRVRASTV